MEASEANASSLRQFLRQQPPNFPVPKIFTDRDLDSTF